MTEIHRRVVQVLRMLAYLQQQTVVDLREDGRVVVHVGDGDGDENRR